MTINVNKIKTLIINGDLTMSETKTPRVDEVEEVLVLKQHRAKPVGALVAKTFYPGEKYKISGLDKLEVLANSCTRDLKAVVPVNPKRKEPEAGTEINADPVSQLAKKLDALIDLLKPILQKKA